MHFYLSLKNSTLMLLALSVIFSQCLPSYPLKPYNILDFRQETLYIQNFATDKVVATAGKDSKVGDHVVMVNRKWGMLQEEHMTWIHRGQFINGLNELALVIRRAPGKQEYSAGDPVVLSCASKGTVWMVDGDTGAIVSDDGAHVLTVAGKDANGSSLLVVDYWKGDNGASQRWKLKSSDNLIRPPSADYLEMRTKGNIKHDDN